VASLGLLPVVLSDIKRCDSQQGDSDNAKTACVGNNSITNTMHKATHSMSSHTWSNCPGSLFVFCTVCDKKLGRSLGTRLILHVHAIPTNTTMTLRWQTSTTRYVSTNTSWLRDVHISSAFLPCTWLGRVQTPSPAVALQAQYYQWW